MSLVPVYVRARDAAFYRNPVVAFPEGFLCFDDESPPELVLWLGEKGEVPEPALVLAARFGRDPGVTRIGQPKIAQRVVPGMEPPLFKPAAGFDLELARRIPQPKFHEGTVRRTNRVGQAHVIDFPADPRDAYELAVSE